jgi:hypothetical protein
VTLTDAKLLSKSVGPGNDVGVDVHSGGSFTVSGTTFTGHSTAAVRAFDKLKMTVSGSTFTGNLVGIQARDAGTISLTVTGTTMSQNLVGILARSLKLRNSTFTFNSPAWGSAAARRTWAPWRTRATTPSPGITSRGFSSSTVR